MADDFRCVKTRPASLIKTFAFVRMLLPLGDNQAVDAIGREISHVTIEKTRSLAAKHAIAIANHGANRGAGTRQRAFANSRWQRAKIGMRAEIGRAHV